MWAMAFMVGSSLLSSAGQAYGGMQTIKMAKYSRDVARSAATYQDALANIDAAKLDRLRDQTISAQTAATAASGIRTDVGAPLELRAETEILADIDKNILRISGGVEGLRFGMAGHTAMAQGYGQASAMFARGLGYSLDTASLLAARKWGSGGPTTDNTLSETRIARLKGIE